jgi:hypothetical protein
MTVARTQVAEVAEILARAVAERSRDRVRVVFELTLRGFDYDTVIDALHYGLRVGLFHQQGSRLVAAGDRRQEI